MRLNTAIELDDGNFEQEVILSDRPVMVEFSDESCQSRASLQDVLDDLAKKYEGRATIAHLDTDINQQVPCLLGVTHLPTVLVFQNGHIVDRFVGDEPREVFCTAIDETLNPIWVI
jgi:thioredoxin 1